MNTQKLQQIEHFVSFIDFIENPKEYKAIINEIGAAVAVHNKMMYESRKISDIDTWRQSEEKKYNDMRAKNLTDKDMLALAMKEFEDKKGEFLKVEQTYKEMVSQTRKEFEKTKQDIGDLTKEKAVLVEKLKVLEAKELKLDSITKELETKQEALNKVFGK